MGANTHLISAFSTKDSHTKYLQNCMKNNEINIDSCFNVTSDLNSTINHACSQAFIFLLPSGENSIIVTPAVNNHWPSTFNPTQMNSLSTCDAILLQREIPEECNLRIARIAHANEIPIVLDVGGSVDCISDELYSYLNVLSPNETELALLMNAHFVKQMKNENNDGMRILIQQKERLSNIDSLPKMKEACEILQTYNSSMNVLLKRGQKGCVLFDCYGNILIQPAMNLEKNQVLDCTGAGDTFLGAFVVEWIRQKKYAEIYGKVDVDGEEKSNANESSGKKVENCERLELEYFGNAMRFACAAAGFSVQKKGTIPSIPHLDEVVQYVLANNVV